MSVTDTILTKSLTHLLTHISGQSAFSMKDLKVARDQLWSRYQREGQAGFLSDKERIAYILARLPSTYAACVDVLKKLPYDGGITAVLDLGCGPGTGTLACLAEGIGTSYTLMENDSSMLSYCRNMVSLHTQNIDFIQQNLVTKTSYPKSDLVMLSYVLGELSPDEQRSVLAKAFDAAEKYLVIISPGTSILFESYLKWRQSLIEKGGIILAPCPSNKTCPMSTIPGRWCHFKARVNRTKELKYLKDASMSFEDEPYSYLIISKNATNGPANESYRIIDHPEHRKGHSYFPLCTGDGITTVTSSAKDPTYKEKKKLTWGDAYP